MSELKQREPYETKLMFKQRQISHLVKERDTLREEVETHKRFRKLESNRAESYRKAMRDRDKEITILKGAHRLAIEELITHDTDESICKYIDSGGTDCDNFKSCALCLTDHFLTQATPEGG